MRFINQFIQNFISRFRSDVYLENIETGTIASGSNLGLDSNNKIVKAADVDLATLAGGATAGRYLKGNGSSITLSAIANSDIGTLNQDTTGNAATATNLVASTSTAVQLGSIEIGHASDTTIARNSSGVITVEGKEVRTADRQIQAVYSSFQADDIQNKHYIAFNDGDSENEASTNVDLPIVAPFAGKLLTVSIRQSRNTSTHTYTLRLETQAAGVSFSTGPTIVATQSGSSPSNTSIVTYDFRSGLDNVGESNVINAGDVVFVSLQSGDAPGGSTKYFITCLFEWDYSSLT